MSFRTSSSDFTAQARTHEGTGIGLALVQELVRLHGGNVRVESEFGKGTTFIISIPTGAAHLPADRISAERALESTALSAKAYVEEGVQAIWRQALKSHSIITSQRSKHLGEPMRRNAHWFIE